MSKLPALAPPIAADASRPDLLDVASLLFDTARGQPAAARLTLLDAAQILIDRARADLAAPAQVAAPARRARTNGAAHRRKIRAPASVPQAQAATAPPPARRDAAPGGGQRSKVEDEAEPEILDHNGVTATIGARSASIEHADRVIEVSPRQARLVACLARAMPQPVDRKFIAGKVWAGQRVPEASDTIISNLVQPIVAPLAAMGLTLKTVRGVGVALQKAGE